MGLVLRTLGYLALGLAVLAGAIGLALAVVYGLTVILP